MSPEVHSPPTVHVDALERLQCPEQAGLPGLRHHGLRLTVQSRPTRSGPSPGRPGGASRSLLNPLLQEPLAPGHVMLRRRLSQHWGQPCSRSVVAVVAVTSMLALWETLLGLAASALEPGWTAAGALVADAFSTRPCTLSPSTCRPCRGHSSGTKGHRKVVKQNRPPVVGPSGG